MLLKMINFSLSVARCSKNVRLRSVRYYHKYSFEEEALEHKSLVQLVKENCYFQVGKSQALVSFVRKIYSSDFGKLILSPFLKMTVFRHFCGGETFDDCKNLIQGLHSRFKIFTVLDQSCEDVVGDENYEQNVEEKLSLIAKSKTKFAHEVQFIPLKLTALMPFQLLEQLTSILNDSLESSDSYVLEKLSNTERSDLDKVLNRLERICKAAQSSSISLLLDAEQTTRQPAVEFIFRILAAEFNKVSQSPGNQPVLYNTYQCYLKRSSRALLRDFEYCRDRNLIFAGKIVRGAYMMTEKEISGRNRTPFPIFSSKAETDANYNQLVTFLLQEKARRMKENHPESSIFLFFGTHNRDSLEIILKTLHSFQIPYNSSSIWFAQILGMTDNLTHGLRRSDCNVCKLVLFGQFHELMPWMLRRLEENQVSWMYSKMRSVYD